MFKQFVLYIRLCVAWGGGGGGGVLFSGFLKKNVGGGVDCLGVVFCIVIFLKSY